MPSSGFPELPKQPGCKLIWKSENVNPSTAAQDI
jgi:hypothetical protein